MDIVTVAGLLTLFLSTANALLVPGLELRVASSCTQDNCYRAVQHTTGRYVTRGGTADCSAYLITTVTPATSTVIVTSSQTSPTTQTSHVTATVATTHVTPVTTTTYTTAITTTTVSVAAAEKRNAVQKRAAATIPDYASSACAGNLASRYSSACSCLGVTATVIMASTPLSTSTTYVVTSPTSTTTATDASVTATVTDGTTTTTTTESVTATATAHISYELVQGPADGCFYDPDEYDGHEYYGSDCRTGCSADPSCVTYTTAYYKPGGGTACVLISVDYRSDWLYCNGYSDYSGEVVYRKIVTPP